MTNGNDSATGFFVNEGHAAANYRVPGLSKREYFAGLAMQGMLANSFYAQQGVADMDKAVSARSCQIADALIAELNKQ